MKREEKTEITKQKILSAAFCEFGENGYWAASLNNICATGIPKGLLYHNFKSKDDLYLACVGICFSDLTGYLKNADPGSDPQKYMSARLCFFKQNELKARIFFDAVLQPPEHLHEQIQDLRKDFDELNTQLYKKILACVKLRKGVSPEDAFEYFSILQAAFNGYFSSPECRKLSFTEKMTAHETSLTKLLDLMIFGIAEREEIQ